MSVGKPKAVWEPVAGLPSISLISKKYGGLNGFTEKVADDISFAYRVVQPPCQCQTLTMLTIHSEFTGCAPAAPQKKQGAIARSEQRVDERGGGGAGEDQDGQQQED